MIRKPFWIVPGLIILLSACSVGPKYAKPTVPSAPLFTEPPPAGWKTAQPADAEIKGQWWELFGDSQLNTLEEQVAPANQSLKIAEANFRQARAQIQIARSRLAPTVGTAPNISHVHTSSRNPTGIPGRQYALFDLPVDVSWDIDFWGRIRRGITSATEQYQASAADLENVKLQLQAELAASYFEARSLDAQKRILDDTVVAYQKALDLTRNRYNGGVASRVEVAQAQTQLNQTEAQAMDVNAARAQFQHAIAVLIGKTPESYTLPPTPLQGPPPVVPVGLPSQLLERRPDIAIAERQVAIANEQIGIAQSAFFPDLVVTATGGFSAGSMVNWFTWPGRFWSVGPTLAQTIFDAGRRRAQVQSTQAAYDETVANYRQTSLVALQEVEDNLSSLRILEEEAAKQHEATAAAEDSLQL